ALWRRVGDHLALDAATVGGETLRDIIARWPAWTDEAVIRPLDRPVAAGEAIAVLTGSLAPDSAVIKLAAATPTLFSFEGPALVFDSLDDLARRVDDPALGATPQHCLILRNAGPVGAPGMPEAGALPIPRALAAQGVKDMVRISDARMSGTAFGTVVLHVAPEAAAGGPLALVRDGDRVRLDVPARRLDLMVGEEELARRRAAWRPPPRPARGYARLYAEHVMQAPEGCDFDFLAGVPAASEP
ncbi:MAG: dihydroxy-acid dehydratase, partial [Rhodospirillaceae bacterium]|nr:dihydroxy-acid dehydratase [Rhodospirillaceae bacterium]